MRSVGNETGTCDYNSTVFFFCSQIDDDNLSKLEKADILELTVNHLTKLHSPKDPVLEAKKFQAGFGQCAAEACRFIMSVPDLDAKVSQNLIGHLSRLITAQPLTIQVPERQSFSPPVSPSSDRHHYYSDHERSSPDTEDTIYATEGSSMHSWPLNSSNNYHKNIPIVKHSPPMGGLLTTVDKLEGSHEYDSEDHIRVRRNDGYYNRSPIEAKDVILQKIRQHIMDKRSNEMISSVQQHDAQYKEETHIAASAYSYNSNNDDTLDLRKVRSPTKSALDCMQSPEKPLAYQNVNRLDTVPLSGESKVEVAASLPEQCELPMDYSNLPPKKKRKLIEYQEYKKQEEARRQLEVFYSEKKACLDNSPSVHDVDGSAWRPW